MGLRLVSLFVLVAVCSQSQTVTCNDLDEFNPKGTQLLKHGLSQGLDYTNLRMTPEEKRLQKTYEKYRRRTKKSLAATVAMYFGGLALAAVGATMIMTPNPDLTLAGSALAIPGAVSFLLGAIPLSVMGLAAGKGLAARKALIDLARQRAENNRRHDLLSSLMKRRIVSSGGKFVGDEARLRNELLQPEMDASGTA